MWRLLREERVPLVLVGVGYYHPIYHALSRYPHLTEHGVEGNFEHATPQEIHTRVWPIVSAWFQTRKDQVVSEYTQLVGREQVMDDLQMVAQAAVHGQVRRLLVEEHAHLWGMLDRRSGKVVQYATQQNTHDGDVLNDLTVVCARSRRGGTDGPSRTHAEQFPRRRHPALVDEAFTPDSSRFWRADTYQPRVSPLSKICLEKYWMIRNL